MLKKFGIALFAVLLVSFVVVPSGAQNLVLDPGFENPAGTFVGSPWTVTPAASNSLIEVNKTDPHSDTYAAHFGAGTLNDTISQTLFTTVPFQTYTFSFWLANPTGLPSNDFSAFWNGTSLSGGAIPALPLVSAATFPYTQYTFTETSGPVPTVIIFSGAGGVGPARGAFFLDDVSVTPVSEPASLLLLGAGLMGMAVIGRKK